MENCNCTTAYMQDYLCSEERLLGGSGKCRKVKEYSCIAWIPGLKPRVTWPRITWPRVTW